MTPIFNSGIISVKTVSVISTAVFNESISCESLTAAITPSATSSKVLIQVNIPLRLNGDLAIDVSLYKASSQIFLPGNDAGDNGTGTHENLGPYSFSYLDSPSTTSAITYTIYGAQGGAGYGNITTSSDSSSASVIMFEIDGS